MMMTTQDADAAASVLLFVVVLAVRVGRLDYNKGAQERIPIKSARGCSTSYSRKQFPTNPIVRT